MKLLRWILLLAAVSALEAATYYVDSAKGDDGNSGTAAGRPWKSLAKVNATEFRPGDRILFKSGSAWLGQLAPRSSGAAGAPIILDRYGKGPQPRIDGGGKVEDAVKLYNVQHIELRNLEITNRGEGESARRGVHIFLDNFGDAGHIVVAGLYVHDVNGTNKTQGQRRHRLPHGRRQDPQPLPRTHHRAQYRVESGPFRHRGAELSLFAHALESQPERRDSG